MAKHVQLLPKQQAAQHEPAHARRPLREAWPASLVLAGSDFLGIHHYAVGLLCDRDMAVKFIKDFTQVYRLFRNCYGRKYSLIRACEIVFFK
jgi:hypothetical protein